MNKTTKVITVMAAGALVAALGLTACGGNNASSSSANSNASASASSAASNTSASASSASTNANANTNTASSSASSADSASIVETAFIGFTDDEKYQIYYYDISDMNDPTVQSIGMLVFADNASNDVKMYSGLATLEADGSTVTIADETNGTMKMVVNGVDENGAMLMTFDTYGPAKVAVTDASSVAQAIAAIMPSDDAASGAAATANSNTNASSTTAKSAQ